MTVEEDNFVDVALLISVEMTGDRVALGVVIAVCVDVGGDFEISLRDEDTREERTVEYSGVLGCGVW